MVVKHDDEPYYIDIMLYLLHGNDEYLLRQDLAQIRSGADYGYNQDTYSGSDANIDTLISACETMPFLSERRLVVLLGLPKERRRRSSKAEETKAGSKKRAAKESFEARLSEYISSVPPFTDLIIVVDEPLDGSHPILVAAQKVGKVHYFASPKGYDLEKWLRNWASQQQIEIAVDAVRLLISFIGSDLRTLTTEITKLSLYAGSNGKITAKEVQMLTPATAQVKVFDLTDAILENNKARAMAILHELLDEGESHIGLVAILAAQMRNLIQVKELSSQGYRSQQIAQIIGLPSFVVDRAANQARRFSMPQMVNIYKKICETDAGLKRSRMAPDLALELLIYYFESAEAAKV